MIKSEEAPKHMENILKTYDKHTYDGNTTKTYGIWTMEGIYNLPTATLTFYSSSAMLVYCVQLYTCG